MKYTRKIWQGKRQQLLGMLLMTSLIIGCHSKSTVEVPEAIETAKLQETHPKLKVIHARPSQQLTVLKYDNTLAILEIKSPFGIGAAELLFTDGRTPARVSLRLLLKGLENFEVHQKARQWRCRVSSASAQPVVSQEIRTTNTGRWQKIDANHQYWQQVRLIPGKGEKPKIPLQGGYFEIMLSNLFLANNNGMLSLKWIDFYRSHPG